MMNQRKIGSILSYFSIFLTNAVALIYTPYMLKLMGQSEYGLYGTAQSFVSYLSLLSFGIGGAYFKFNAQCRTRKDREAERKLNGMFFSIFAFLAILVFVCGMVLIHCVGRLVKNTFTQDELFKMRVIMFVLVLNTMSTFLSMVVMAALQAYEKFIFIRIVSITAAILNPIVNIIALTRGGGSVSLTVITFVISIMSHVAYFIYARKEIALEFSFGNYDKTILKKVCAFSSFLFLNSVTEQITFSTDSIILGAVQGTKVVAIYTVGAHFKSYFMSFSSAISSVFSPQINKIVAEERAMTELDELFIRIGRIQFYVVSLILLGYISIGKAFVRLWAGNNYEDSYYIGLFLMLSVAIPLFQNIGLEIQKAKNMHKARSVVYFLIALVNIAITIPLSIRYSGMGAAFATLICMFMGTVVFMNIYYQKKVGLNIIGFWKSIGQILPGLFIPCVVGCLINQYWCLESYVDIFSAILVIVFSYISSVWFISMNRYEKKLFAGPVLKVFNKNRQG